MCIDIVGENIYKTVGVVMNVFLFPCRKRVTPDCVKYDALLGLKGTCGDQLTPNKETSWARV